MRTRMAKSERAAIATICSRSARQFISWNRPWSPSAILGAVTVEAFAWQHRLSHTPCSGAPRSKVSATNSTCPRSDTVTLRLRVCSPIKSIFFEDLQRRCFGQCIVFSQNLALQRRRSLHAIFVTRRPCLKMFKALCEPGLGLSGIQAFASQL